LFKNYIVSVKIPKNGHEEGVCGVVILGAKKHPIRVLKALHPQAVSPASLGGIPVKGIPILANR
jgi:hypothetical protein